MGDLTGLILVGVLALVAAGAGFAFVQPRRFTDRDADGAPDPWPEEVAQAREHDAWGRKDQGWRARNKKAAPRGG